MATPNTTSEKNPSNLYVYDETTDKWYAVKGSSLGAITTTPSTITDTPEFFEDTNFVTGDSPATIDINAALGRNATSVSVINDGPGNFTIALSTDGAIYGDSITIKAKEEWEFIDIDIDSIRVTWVSNSAYRITAI